MLFNKAAVQPSAEAGESADKKGETLKKYLHIWQLSFAGFEVFVTVFSFFYTDYILLSAAKILHRQNNSKLAQVSLPADWFIVHLGIVVT